MCFCKNKFKWYILLFILILGNPECIRCRSGYFISDIASEINFGKDDCVETCPISENSSVIAQLIVETSTNQVVKEKDDICLLEDEILNAIDDCFLYGPILRFEPGIVTFPNRCFYCHSYAHKVISLFDTIPKGNNNIFNII